MADDNTNTDAPVVSEESIVEAPKAENAKEAAEVLKDSDSQNSGESDSSEKSETQSSSDSQREGVLSSEKKSAKSVSKDLEDIISKIEKLSVLELADLVHALEDRFGVTAAAPMAMAAGPAAAGSAEPAEEKTSFNVVLTNAGANKIGAIKAVREIVPTLGLKEAKDLVESAPKPVLEGVNKATADEAKAKLTAAGATVELQ
jgi:large subunit ribosomal protein L7/L12